MPRYYFNIYDHGRLIVDEEGTDLPDVAAARKEAEEGARELLADALRAHTEINGKSMEILDASGNLIATLKVRDVLS
jgi:hypothetical protein